MMRSCWLIWLGGFLLGASGLGRPSVPATITSADILGHRGGAGEHPENTLYGFGRALDAGISLEMDIRKTGDGEIVVIHDETTGRTCNADRVVAQKTVAELQTLDAAYRYDPKGDNSFPLRGQGITIPTLEETLQLFLQKRTPGAILWIDTKDDEDYPFSDNQALYDRLVQLIGRYGLWNEAHIEVSRTQEADALRSRDSRIRPVFWSRTASNIQAAVNYPHYVRIGTSHSMVSSVGKLIKDSGKELSVGVGRLTQSEWDDLMKYDPDSLSTDYTSDLLAYVSPTPSNQSPTARITLPGSDGLSFPSQSTLSFTGTGSDPEDGALAGGSLTWWIDRMGDGFGPAALQAMGTSGSQVLMGWITNPGGEGVRLDAVGDNYDLILRAADSQGATGVAKRRYTVSPTGGGDPGGAFSQDPGAKGIVSIEAEHYHDTLGQGGHSWIFVTSPAGYAGSGAMEASPDSGAKVDTGYAAGSPHLAYQVSFTRTGTHYIWILGAGSSGANDSVHVGLDGVEIATSDRMWGFGTGWTWSAETMDGPTATFDVPSAGVHTVNVWMREDGFDFDKLVLTTDPAYVPAGTGPSESPTGGGSGGGGASRGCGSTGIEVLLALWTIAALRRNRTRSVSRSNAC